MTMAVTKPMELTPLAEPFDGEDYLFQIKWDGIRCLAGNYNGDIRLYNRKLSCRNSQYPEIVSAVSTFLPEDTLLDGEIIALNIEGKPDFYRLLKRDLARSPARAQSLARSIPVYYMVFDLLYLRGKKLLARQLSERLELLNELLPRMTGVVVVDSLRERGRDLFQIAREQELEGIVAKQIHSPYIPGKKTGYWFKIKAFRHLDAIIAGYSRGNGISLLLAVEDEEGLTYIGNAGSGLTHNEWQELIKELDKHKSPSCPVRGYKAKADITWVQPRIKVRVKYLEQNRDFKLRNPVIEQVLGE